MPVLKQIPVLLRELADCLERGEEVLPAYKLSKKYRIIYPQVQNILRSIGLPSTKTELLCSVIEDCVKQGKPIPSIKKLAAKTSLKESTVIQIIRRHKLPLPTSDSEQIRQEVLSFIEKDEEVPPAISFAKKYKVSRQLVEQACRGIKTGWKPGCKKKLPKVAARKQIMEEVLGFIEKGLEVPPRSFFAKKYNVNKLYVSQVCRGIDKGWKAGTRHGYVREGSVSEQIRQIVSDFIKKGKKVPSCSTIAQEYCVSRQLVGKVCKGMNTGWKIGRPKKS